MEAVNLKKKVSVVLILHTRLVIISQLVGHAGGGFHDFWKL